MIEQMFGNEPRQLNSAELIEMETVVEIPFLPVHGLGVDTFDAHPLAHAQKDLVVLIYANSSGFRG